MIQRGDTAVKLLACAVEAGNLYLLTRLLNMGSSTNFQTASGESLLQIAVNAGHCDIATILLENGDNSTEVTREG